MRRATPAPVRSLRMCGVPVLSLKYKRRPRPLPISSVWVETAPAAAPISSNGNRFLRHRHPCVRSTARWMTSATSSTRPVPTGKPKGAMLSHGNWMTALDAEREALRLRPDDVYLGIYPMGHVGFSWGLAVLRAGGTFVMMERFDPDRYLALAKRHKVTVLAGMPPVIHTLVHSAPATEDYLRTARLIISGGGQLLPAIWEAFDRRYHIPVANSYGLSETIVIGSGTTTLPEYPALTRNYQSVGVAAGYTEVRIVDVDDPEKEMPPEETGEIALRGPSVAQGYWNQPEATAAVFRHDGWFLTGDIGNMDRDGVLFITDRKKDMIIMSGWKIYPTEVENVIIQHLAVADVAVFGIPDERKGEVPVAAIVLRAGSTLSETEFDSFCRMHLAG